jgi:hypothetical protein
MLSPKYTFIRFFRRIFVLIALTFTFHAFHYTQTRSFTGTYTENFNTLASTGAGNTWTNDVTIDGWQSSLTTYDAGTGSSNNGGLYSFGNAASADRALGSLASSGTGTVNFGACFTNNTGFTIAILNINYTGEQWRVGSTPALGDTIAFSYQTGVNSILAGGTWTNIAALNFASPTISPNNAAVDGNVAPNRIVIPVTPITGLNITNGTDFCIRWTDLDNTGADYGASIDDLTVTATTVTASTAVIRGRVVNEFGRPVSRASITITNTQSGESKYVMSNQLGYFNFIDLNVGDFYVLNTVRKGYQFDQTGFQLLENLDRFTISGTRITN